MFGDHRSDVPRQHITGRPLKLQDNICVGWWLGYKNPP